MFPCSTDYSVRLGQEGRAGGGGDRSDGNGSPSLIQRGPAGRVVSQPIKGLGGKREIKAEKRWASHPNLDY